MLSPDNPRAAEFSQDIDETNAGDPQQLVDFVRWAAASAPAQTTILALSGHGLAWQDRRAADLLGTRGVLTSATSDERHRLKAPRGLFKKRRYDALLANRRQLVEAISRGPGGSMIAQAIQTRSILIDGSSSDFLSTHELAQALLSCTSTLGRRIDVLVCDACLMSAVEILAQIAPHAGQFVGSVDELVGAGINFAGAVSRCTERSRGGDNLTPAEIAKSFVEAFTPAATFDSCLSVDLSGASWKAAQGAFKRFVASMLQWMASSSAANRSAIAGQFVAGLKQAPELTKYGVNPRIPESSIADIGALALAMDQQLPTMPTIVKEELRVARGLYAGSITAKRVGDDYQGNPFVGLSIYVPRSQGELLYNQSDYATLEFSKSTGWGRLLETAYR